MRTFQKAIVLLLILFIVGASVVWAAPAKVYTLKLAYAASADSTSGKSVALIKQRLEAQSAGRIKVEIYPGAQLGGDREMIEACQVSFYTHIEKSKPS